MELGIELMSMDISQKIVETKDFIILTHSLNIHQLNIDIKM
jgi:hypothetical protein